MPSHVHFTITAEGFRPYGSEFVLGDDPFVTPETREDIARRGELVADRMPAGDPEDATGPPRYAVTIPLRPGP